MMKQKMNLWLLAALMCGMSLSVASCKDDDSGPSAEEQEKEGRELLQQGNAAFAVIDMLANTDEAGDDFLLQTFPPAIGTADSGDEGVRIVDANTMAAAAERFADLADAAIDENTTSYTWHNDALGTMTYHKSQDGKSWATVDVDIRQVPHLRKIIYRNPDQTDENASGKFKGRAYYRFGDVVSRQVETIGGEKVTEYWVCVRPAFSLEKKGDSHWVCLNALPKKNIASYTYTFDKKKPTERTQTWYVPTKLGEEKLHMQNLAEMLYAMINPAEWETNVKSSDKPKLKMFNDFDRTNVKYHNQNFWKYVTQKWDETKYAGADGKLTDLWQLVFNANKSQISGQINHGESGLRLLYNGYSWWWSSSWYCDLWEAIYTKGTGNSSNMHEVSLVPHTESMENIEFDCRTMGRTYKNYHNYFNGGDYQLRWCIRHATGKELVAKGGSYDVRSKIKGVTDVYRYYRDVNETSTGDLANLDPEETGEEDFKYLQYGSILPGTIIEDEDSRRWFCYSGWCNIPGMFTTKDHKARFISFDGLTTETETIAGTENQGMFVTNDDLLPESEAPACAIVLNHLTWSHDEGLEVVASTMREKIGEYFPALQATSLKRWETFREIVHPVYGSKDEPGFVNVLCVAYKPEGGRKPGTQPYLRCIIDGSTLATNRIDMPSWIKYPHLRFFKKYNEKDGKTLDLTHSFRSADFVYLDDIKADEYSKLKNLATGKNGSDFSFENTYTLPYNTTYYNILPENTLTTYFERAIIVRYLEFDDPSGEFHTTYDGKKYKLLYQPTGNLQDTMIADGLSRKILSRGYNPGTYNWCTMDGEKFDLGYFSFSSMWPRATDGQ